MGQLTNRPGHAPVPNDRLFDPRMQGFSSEQEHDNVRFSPHKLYFDLFTRVNECLAAGVDPLPSYRALNSAMRALGKGDAEFVQEMAEIKTRCARMFGALGHMDRMTYVSWHMEAMWSLAIRKGVINLAPAGYTGGASETVPGLRRVPVEGPSGGTAS